MAKDESLIDATGNAMRDLATEAIDGVMNAIVEAFTFSSPSGGSSGSSKDDDRDSSGGLFCNVPSHK